MSYRKNVFILGAGASFHAGAPLMNNFLEVAEDIAGRGLLETSERERFDRVLSFRKKIETAEAKAGLDLTNLEDLFGLVDVNLRVNPKDPEAQELRKDFIFLILRTLQQTIQDERRFGPTIFTGQPPQPQGAEPRTASQHFVDVVSRRWEALPSDGVVRDSIISLNYDLVIEGAMAQRGLAPDYCLENGSQGTTNDPAKPRIKLLKLHGSGNWVVCSDCDGVQVVPGAVCEVESATCICGHTCEPLIVPPTWSKGEHPTALDNVWEEAFKQLRSAQRLVLVGVSLPPSDRFLRYLLGLALALNRDLDRIEVVNRAGGKPYGTLFDGLPKWVKHPDPPTITFEDTVSNGLLQRVLGQSYSQTTPKW